MMTAGSLRRYRFNWLTPQSSDPGYAVLAVNHGSRGKADLDSDDDSLDSALENSHCNTGILVS